MASAHSDLNIIILDACRNNPIDPNGAKGLSRIDSNARLFISYATSPGLTALDGTGNNSPYAKYLYQSIDAPNLDIEDTFKRTLKGVYIETKGEQTPWISSTFFGDFVFRPAGASRRRPAKKDAAGRDCRARRGRAPKTIDLGGVYRVEGTNPSGSKYRGMVALRRTTISSISPGGSARTCSAAPGTSPARCSWSIGATRTPVVYTFGDKGSLDGEWADGSATETLNLVANAAPGDIALSEGSTRSKARTRMGATYEGTVEIEKQGNGYHLSWKVGNSSYEGKGQPGRQSPDRRLGKLDACRLCARHRRQPDGAVGRGQGRRKR